MSKPVSMGCGVCVSTNLDLREELLARHTELGPYDEHIELVYDQKSRQVLIPKGTPEACTLITRFVSASIFEHHTQQVRFIRRGTNQYVRTTPL
mgnify:CR=1 FL=1